MAGLLNPRSREDVRDNSFGDYAEGLLSNAGNSVKDWYTGMHPMDQVAVATAPIPLLGDITGAAADARMFYEEPESRTWANAGMSAAGLLPFVPALSIAGRKAKTLNPNAPKRPLTEFEQSHAAAQKNAALPVSEGGLGLPKDNTATDRAKAMGFDVDTMHYSRNNDDIKIIKEGNSNLSILDSLGMHSGTRNSAIDRAKQTRRVNPDTGALNAEEGGFYPLMIKSGKKLVGNDGLPYSEQELSAMLDLKLRKEIGGEPWEKGSKEMLRSSVWNEYDSAPYRNAVEDAGSISFIAPPKNIRSPNAAFDPMKRDSSDLLSSAGLLGGYGNRRSFA